MVPRHVRDVQDVFAGATLLLLEEFGQGLQEPAEEQLVVRSMEDDLLVAPIRAVGIQDVDAHGGLGALLVPTLRLEQQNIIARIRIFYACKIADAESIFSA